MLINKIIIIAYRLLGGKMYENLIKQYIDNLKIDEVKALCQNNDIKITNDEALLLLECVKKNWVIFYKGDPSKIINDLETKINPEAFLKLKKLYIKYKNKISY